MSYLLTCPNCGVREVTDFALRRRGIGAAEVASPSFRELNTYNYFRRNVAGVQREWWFHRSGCRAWFIAERNTVTNEVLMTALPAEAELAEPATPGRRMSRLPQQPGERIQRQKLVRFTFDGKKVEAYEGDTIGSALYAAGRRTSRAASSTTAARGLMCCAGQCPNCIVAVDGAPGARACTEQVREGMKVEHVNADPEPRVRRDAGDRPGRRQVHSAGLLLQDVHPARGSCGRCTRRCSGTPPAWACCARQQPEREWRTEYRRRHADVLVVGGGIAGLTAARAAAELGADVVLVDEGAEPGGKLLIDERRDGSPRCCRRPRRGRRDPRPRLGARLLRRDGPGLAGRHAPPDPGPRATCSPPARSSSRWCSPATTCPA